MTRVAGLAGRLSSSVFRDDELRRATVGRPTGAHGEPAVDPAHALIVEQGDGAAQVVESDAADFEGQAGHDRASIS